MGQACAGKVALVTGAAGQGMGRSIALTLAREGAKVVVNYRTSREAAGVVVEHIASRGGEAVAVQADVFTAEGCQKVVDAAVKRFGQVDICVIGPGGGWGPKPLHEMDAAKGLADVQQEVAPIYQLLPLVLTGMYQRQWGRVIALSLAPPFNSPDYAYNVGKAARTAAIKIACGEAWSKGVTLNVISPGPVDAIKSLASAIEQCDHGGAWLKRENVSPQDIAEGVAFLCSEAGRFVSGCELPYMFR